MISLLKPTDYFQAKDSSDVYRFRRRFINPVLGSILCIGYFYRRLYGTCKVAIRETPVRSVYGRIIKYNSNGNGRLAVGKVRRGKKEEPMRIQVVFGSWKYCKNVELMCVTPRHLSDVLLLPSIILIIIVIIRFLYYTNMCARNITN